MKSMKTQLKRVIGDTKLTFEEFATVLMQVEACLNSYPLVPSPCNDDGIEALTPGHFLISKQVESLQDPSSSSLHLSSLLMALVSVYCWSLLAAVVFPICHQPSTIC